MTGGLNAMTEHLFQITGNERQAGDGSPLDAIKGFYRAFNVRDMNALATSWLDDERASMDNPIGGIRLGWNAIREGYSILFEGKAEVKVAFEAHSSQGGKDWHLFVGRERGFCRTPEANLELRIRTSRLFVRVDENWRQLHHHGSIEEPALLAEYQRMIFGAPLSAPA
jgi:hypothetical protein